MPYTEDFLHKCEQLKHEISMADAIVIGAGAGLSTAAGYTYSGDWFHTWFFDFEEKYGFKDMYSGGFYPFETLEEYWAYWSRYIYINRYMNPPFSVYEKMYQIVKDKDYFVLTNNVDHCFQKAGFDKKHLFYTQGDYGLFQCSTPCHDNTYDNHDQIVQMVKSQGFIIDTHGNLQMPQGSDLSMEIPSSLIPYCPRCGKPMTMNLRADHTFVQDKGWYKAAQEYKAFLDRNRNRNILFFETGVGYNTPGIIKYPFWQMTLDNPNAVYVCINSSEAYVPSEIRRQSICIQYDIKDVLSAL